jgi:hypothetical protein
MRTIVATPGLLSLGCLATLAAVPLVACDKDDGKGAGSAVAPSASAAAVATPPPSASASAASASASAMAQTPLPKCPTGLTGNALPVFCMKLPSSYKVKDARTLPDKGSISYDTGTTTDNLMIS